MACSLPFQEDMDRICEHCGESIVGNAYRVISEERGITFLDMIVCSPCYMEAKRLHLHTEEIDLRGKQASARTQGRYSSRPEI
jgi:superfamily II helicase